MSVGLYAAVAAGGAIGAMLRYTVSLFLGAGLFGFAGPLATVTVNVVGSGLMGLLAGLLAGGFVLPEPVRAFVVIGLLGALTTFSSFALDAGTLLQKQGLLMAMVYIGLSVCLSLASFAASFGVCFWLARVPS